MNQEQDILFQAAEFYNEHLNSKRFELVIQKAKRTESIEIRFFPEAFHHLIGLHKLKDIPQVQRSSLKIFHEILSGRLTYHDIASSQYLTEMTDRLKYHKEIFHVLNIKSLFFKSLHGKFKGITADCVICSEISDSGLYGFLFCIRSREPFMNPVSFFTRNENREYTKDGVIWKVVSVSDITPPKKIRHDSQ